MKTLRFVILSMLILLCSGGGAWAMLTPSSSDHMIGFSAPSTGWQGEVKITGIDLSYAVTQSGSIYTYEYTLAQNGSPVGRMITNFDLQVAADFRAGNLLSSSMASTLSAPTLLSEPGPGRGGSEQTLFGYRWNSPDLAHGFTLTLTTDRAPMEGSVGMLFLEASSVTGGYIPVPGGGTSAPVPIPAALFLFAPGLGALIAVAQRDVVQHIGTCEKNKRKWD